MYLLFSSVFSDSDSVDSKLDQNVLNTKLVVNKFYEPENNWENFFLIIIIFALIRRFLIFYLNFYGYHLR